MIDGEFLIQDLLSRAEKGRIESKNTNRIATIISCICNGINTLPAIAEKSRLSKSTTHRILKGLEESFMLIYDPVDHIYYPGILLRYFIAKPTLTHAYLIDHSRKVVDRVGESTGELVIILIKLGLKQVPLYIVPSSFDVQVVAPNMRTDPLYVGAPGKVLLSQLDDEHLKTIIDLLEFEPDNPVSMPNKEEFYDAIRQIRQQGYAWTANERLSGAMAIAAPIRNYDKPVTLAIFGPESRMKSNFERCKKYLMDGADQISHNLLLLK